MQMGNKGNLQSRENFLQNNESKIDIDTEAIQQLMHSPDQFPLQIGMI